MLVYVLPLTSMVQVEVGVELLLHAMCANGSGLERGVVVDGRVLAGALLGTGALDGAGALMGVGHGDEHDGQQHHAQRNRLRHLSTGSHC